MATERYDITEARVWRARNAPPPWVTDRHHPLWYRFWAKTHILAGVHVFTQNNPETMEALFPILPKHPTRCVNVPWRGAITTHNPKGLQKAYGTFRVEGLPKPTEYAHRLAWIFYHRRLIPKGVQIVHALRCELRIDDEADTNLCLWPACLEAKPTWKYVDPLRTAYSEWVEDEDEQKAFWRNTELIHPRFGGNQITYTTAQEGPLYLQRAEALDYLTFDEELQERAS